MDKKDLVVESSDSRPQADDYVIVSKYRLVKPYHFDFVCNVRQRWQGRSIIDIFSKEFPARDRSYYLQALADGRLRVEGREVGPDTPLKDGMRMRHFIHRHEPPATAGPIQVVGETPDIVAVCKPHGMPVHVAGQYRKNTVHGVLQAERPDLGELLPVHRLDKPVSGLLLFARHAASAEALRQKIEGRTVEKIYVARVLGAFPASEKPILVDVPLGWDPVSNLATAVPLQPTAGAEVSGAATAQGEQQGVQQGERVAAGKGGVGATAPLAGDGRMEVDEAVQEGALAETNGTMLPDQGVVECDSEGEGGEMQQGGRGSVAQGSGGAAAAQGGLGPGRQQKQKQQQQQQQGANRQPSRRERQAAKRERQAAAAVAAPTVANGEQQQQLPPGKGGKKEAKPAATRYKLLWVAPDGQTSLVECRPLTGRTHQIRVHLQYLGHPIANDTQYGGTYGGPLASRAMAEQLGVSWDEQRQGPPMAGEAMAAAEPAAVVAEVAGEQPPELEAQQERRLQGQEQGNGSAEEHQERRSSSSEGVGIGEKVAGVAAKRPRTEARGTTAGPAGQGIHPAAQQPPPPSQLLQPAEHHLQHSQQPQRQQMQQPSPGPQGGAAPAATAAADGWQQQPGDVYAQNHAFRSRPEFEAPPALHDPLCIHCPYFAPRDYPLDLRPLWLHARTYRCQGGEWSFSTELPEWARRDFVPA